MRCSKKVSFACFFVMVSLSGGCQSPSGPDRTREFTSDKLTRAKEERELNIAVQVKVDQAEAGEEQRVARMFEEQALVFEPCHQLVKSSLYIVKAKWQMQQSGELKPVEIVQATPDEAALKECFLNQIKQLGFERQTKPLAGEITVETHFGHRVRPGIQE